MPGWTAKRGKILYRHSLQKLEVKALLLQGEQYLSPTTDMWSLISKQGYMVITAHFFDDDGVMQHLIVRFMFFMYFRTAESPVQHLCEGLHEMDLLKEL